MSAAPRVPPAASDSASSRRRPAVYLVALLVVLGVIAVGAWVAWLPRAPAPAPPSMLHVPGGPLPVPSPTGDHTIRIRSLDVDRAEVTVAAYRACVEDRACKLPRRDGGEEDRPCNDTDPARLHHPMNCVTVAHAIEYCEWRGARLPTTNEWRYLARNTGPAEDGRPGAAEGLIDMTGSLKEWACNLDPDQEEQDDVVCWTFAEMEDKDGPMTQDPPRAPDMAAPSGGAGIPGKRYWRDGYSSPTLGFRCVK